MSHPLGIVPEPVLPPVLSLGGCPRLTQADHDPRSVICSLCGLWPVICLCVRVFSIME